MVKNWYWPEDEIEILKQEYPESGTLIPALSHRTHKSIQNKAVMLGLTTSRKRPRKHYPIWTQDEIDILKSRYYTDGGKIPELLRGRSVQAVCNKAGQLGLRKKKLPPGGAECNKLRTIYIRNATVKNREFTLSKEEFRQLTQQDCYYCGVKPSTISKTQNRNSGDYTYNGIDRIDNNKGYTIDNVVTACQHCNKARLTRTQEEFKQWIIKVYDHYAKDNQ